MVTADAHEAASGAESVQASLGEPPKGPYGITLCMGEPVEMTPPQEVVQPR